MDRPRPAVRHLRRKISTIIAQVQSHQTLPGETSTDGDYVVLREIREMRLRERKKKTIAVEAFKNSFAENNPDNATELVNIPVTLVEEQNVASHSDIDSGLKENLFSAIKADNLKSVQTILLELKKKDITGGEAFMKTTSKMNILHFAIDNDANNTAEYLIQHSNGSLLYAQEFETIVKGNVSPRNTLHLITVKTNVALAKLLLNHVKDKDLKRRLMYSETGMEIIGQRPRTFTCLHIAAFQGSVELVELYLKLGVSVDLLNSKKDTALLWASRWGHNAVISSLISHGANANIENDKGSTALYWAVRYNHPNAVARLTTVGHANVNQTRKVGLVAPIILASALGYSRVVELLLEGGADANMEIRGGETPLMQASREGHADAAKILLEHLAAVDKQDERGDTPLTLATKFNNPEVVELLLQADANILHKNHEGFGAWHYAICNEDNSVLLTMVKFKFSRTSTAPNKKERIAKPPLCIAASVGQCDKIEFLISVGLKASETDAFGNNMLHHAAINNHHEAIKQFHDQVGINVQNKAGDTPLHIACLHGHSDCISVLVECKAKANVKNNRGDTALHVMGRSAHTRPSTVASVMEYMIKAHAWDSLHVQDLNGNSALHEAASQASCDVLWEFRGLSFKQKNDDGNTPLHLSVRPDHPEVLNTMLEIYETMKRDADINERNNNNHTVLHLAALSGFTSPCATLIRFKADLSAQDKDGNTVFHLLTIASVNDNTKYKQYLDVMNVLLEELVRWWCLSNELIYPDDDKIRYQRIKRIAVHHVTADTLNNDGLSVLTLAAKLGAKQVLEKILMMPFVNYIVKDQKAFFDITHLTPQTNNINKKKGAVSCMEWLTNMTDPHIAGKTFDVPSLRQVEKIYGGICAWTYMVLMLLHLVYMGAFSGIAVTLLYDARSTTGENAALKIAMYVVVPLEPGFILLYMIYLLFRFVITSDFLRKSEIMRGKSPLQAVLAIIGSYFPIIISVLYSALVITWVILFSSGYRYHDYLLSVSLLLGWMFSIFFTRGFQAVNYFWKMLQLMIIRDVFRFMFIYVFILLAFSFAFHILFQVSDSVADLYPSALDTIFTTFNTMIGMDWLFDGEVQSNLALAGRSSVPLKVFHIAYVVLTTIILLNVLIAMMNDSYQNIRVNQTATWRVDAVRLGLQIETMLPWLSGLFSHIKIKQGDILLMHHGLNLHTEGRATPDDIDDTSSHYRWYIEVPLTNLSPESSVYEEDVAHQISSLAQRVETLETKLMEVLHDTQQSVREIQERLTSEGSVV